MILFFVSRLVAIYYLKLGILFPLTKFVTDFVDITEADLDNCFDSCSSVFSTTDPSSSFSTFSGDFATKQILSNSFSDFENIFDSIKDLKLVILTFRLRSLFDRRSIVPVSLSTRWTLDSELSLQSEKRKSFQSKISFDKIYMLKIR